MAYTPELSLKSSGMLRRVAWAAKAPMTRAMEDLIKLLPAVFDSAKVCAACRDKSFCQSCGFAQNNKGGDDEACMNMAPVKRAGDVPTGERHPTGAGYQCITKKRQKEKFYENRIED